MRLEGNKKLLFVGERRAVALLFLGFFTTVFFISGIAQGGAWLACFLAMSAVYGVGFFGIASEWFWGRWFAQGLATSGMTMAVLGLITNGFNWSLAIWGIIHGLIYLPLLGGAMAKRYEGKPEWRERYNLDEQGVARIKRAVNGAVSALPTVIFYALAPRQGQMATVGLLALVALGTFGLVRMRFWGVLALGGAAVWSGLSAMSFGCCGAASQIGALSLPLSTLGLLAAAMLAYAVAPFARPALRTLRSKKL